MNQDLVSLLRCPGCGQPGLRLHAFAGGDGPCEEGVVDCPRCGRWYPITGFVLELVAGPLADQELRAAFWATHREQLVELGLEQHHEEPEPAGEEVELQAGQRRYFDSLAEGEGQTSYEHFMGTSFWRAEDSRLYGGWLPKIEPDSLVLDVGCADGRTTFQLAGHARVLAFDLSAKQIRRAVERARQDGLLESFTFFVADASRFPVADASVDCVLMDGVLHHLPRPADALEETARVLRPGGVYFGKENNDTPLRPIFDWLQRRRPLWFEEAGPEQLISTARIHQWAERAGLSVAVEPTVFLPPHAFSRMSAARTRRVLDATDRLAGRLPGLGKWGGLLVIEGRKGTGGGTAA